MEQDGIADRFAKGEQKRLADELDEDIDRFMEALAEKSKNERTDNERTFDFAKWCEEVDNHPAFARELRPSADGQYSAEMQALQAMKYDDDDPVECANAHKEEGNRHFQQRNYRWAIDAYTKGLKLRCGDVRLNSVLFANRAAANRRLGNVRTALKDCVFARRFEPTNWKAIRRGAECLLELRKAGKCIAWIESSDAGGDGGMSSPSDWDEQLQQLRRQAEAMKSEEDRNARKDRAKTSAEWRRNNKLLEVLRRRGVRLCPPVNDPDDLCQQLQISLGPLDRHAMVQLVEEGDDGIEQLIWPLLLQYPESGQTDFVAECAEHVLLHEALAEVFSSPAHWDTLHNFRFDNVRLFVTLTCADGRERIREILPEQHSLGDVLLWSDVLVTKGLPVIQIYTKEHLERNKLKQIDGGNGIFQFERTL
uniref:Cns1/TTC4 wheel domain-containing protein n=1 Tax=Globodera rostochiensis TaxID=31243 RepID=A0A914I605_GLORO